MDYIVPIVLVLVASLVTWILYDQRYSYRRQLAAIRRKQGDAPVLAIEESARHLIAEGWGVPQAYARALETQVNAAGAGVKEETDRRVRSSLHQAVEAQQEIEKVRTAAHARIREKHAEGIIPGQGPAKRPATPPPEPRGAAKSQAK
jgi:hypothetical protein